MKISFFLVILRAIKKKMTKLKILLFFMLTIVSFAQNEIKINAKLLENGKKMDVVEEITLKNTSIYCYL